MELNELLAALDRTAANLDKLDAVWERAKPFIPTGPARGTQPEYEDLRRIWSDLLVGLPPINGWTVTEPLPDIDEVGQTLIGYFEIGESPVSVSEQASLPGRQLDEYRFRLQRTRRRAVRDRLQHLISAAETDLAHIVSDLPEDPDVKVDTEATQRVGASVDEIERLIGDVARQGRWGDLHRHLHFAQKRDWSDIVEMDWPSVLNDIQAALFTDTEPLPVPDLDLGAAAEGTLTGAATVALPWNTMNDEGFERLLFDLLNNLPDYQNVTWLTNTRAADRGRDLACEQVISSSTGQVRTERVIVQAKHWGSKSVGIDDVRGTVDRAKLWEPPLVRGIIIATSGRFTTDAVDWTEKHNESGAAPLIQLWAESQLEVLLAQRPHIAAAHSLR